ncbi:MAG: DUF2764 family protein [Deltaproteobacteria bacterium]
MLDEESRGIVDLLFSFIAFDTSEAKVCDPKRLALYKKLRKAIPDQTEELVALLIDAADIAAALRARHQKKEPPAMLGSYADHIKRHWQHPQFRLGLRFPWINTVGQLLNNGQIFQAEDEIYQAVWQLIRRQGERHHFSLAALIAYLIQWQLVSRWSAREEKIGAKRFTSLLEEVIDGYDTLFGSASPS